MRSGGDMLRHAPCMRGQLVEAGVMLSGARDPMPSETWMGRVKSGVPGAGWGASLLIFFALFFLLFYFLGCAVWWVLWPGVFL